MKIQGWFVERFGALRNYEIRELPEGLTVFCGPNGSGKSTLFTFMRQILFGGTQAAGRSHGLRQDSWSGRLQCTGPDGVYTITHRADTDGPSQLRITRPDGSEGTESDLERLFGGVDGRTIGSLLSFDINDLQSLPSLPASVRERLFPAGSGRALRAIQRAVDLLQTRKAALSAGANRELQRLASAPVELQARIERATRAAGRLGQLLQSQSQAQVTLDLRTRAIADLTAKHAKYEALVDLSPIWQELTQARREFDATEPVSEFPIDSEQRLESALTARLAAQRSVSQLVDHAARREGGVAVQEAPAPAPASVDTRVPSVVRQRVQLPDSAPVSEDLAAWQRRLKDAVDAARENERELDATERSLRELEISKNEISATLRKQEPPSVAMLDEEARLIQNVRTTLNALHGEQASAKRWQDQIAERGVTVRTLETQVVAIPSSVLAYFAWCLAVAGIVAAVWRYVEGDQPGLMALAAFSIVSAAAASIQGRRRRKALEEDTDRRNQLTNARGELERACQSLLQHQERATRRRFEISVDSVRLGLPPLPAELQLKEREYEVEAQRRQRLEWDKNHEALAQTLAAISRKEEVRRQQAQSVLAAQTHERQTIHQWQQWKIHAGLAEGGAARSTAESVRTESELLENCRRLRIQISEWEQSATDWNSRARAALVGPAEADNRVSADPELEKSPAVQAARRRLRQCEDAVSQLLSQAGVSDEHAFRARLAAYRRRLTLTQTIRTCETRCTERLRREPAADLIRHELSEGQIDDWRRRAAQTRAELTSVETSREDVKRQLKQVEADIAAATTESAELPVLEVERAALMTEAAASVRAARTLAVTSSLLEDARTHFEREAQPPAFRRGSEALSAITFSRYERFGASDDERDLVVFDSKNGWKAADQLSRGTLEQLYFSLRVGLAEESAQAEPRLPIVIDDVLDHFDPKRSQAMARQLVDLSRRHQIFVFTRRPETCELLRNLDPTTHVVNMQEL